MRCVLLFRSHKGWVGVRADDTGEEPEGGKVEALARQSDGALVLDISGVPVEVAKELVRVGPIPDATLPAETYKSALGHGAESRNVFTNKDRVSIDRWVRAWVASCPEARSGRVAGGAIVWDGPEVRPTQAGARA